MATAKNKTPKASMPNTVCRYYTNTSAGFPTLLTPPSTAKQILDCNVTKIKLREKQQLVAYQQYHHYHKMEQQLTLKFSTIINNQKQQRSIIERLKNHPSIRTSGLTVHDVK